MILLPQKWKRQPTLPMAVDWNHPLAQGLLEFGYALPGLVPYSAVAAGSQQPFVTGTGTQDATTNGPAIAVSGTGNYINLGRNISAPTQVASGFIRTTPTATQGPLLYTSGMTAGGAEAGHAIYHNGTTLAARWSDGVGTDVGNRRIAETTAAGALSGLSVSVAFVCRAATDWSLYKDGRRLSITGNSGSSNSYSPGVSNGTVGYRNQAPWYGPQQVSTWAVFARALDDGEMQALHEAPFQLLVKRQRRIWVAVSGGGPTSYTLDTASEVAAAYSPTASKAVLLATVSDTSAAFGLVAVKAAVLTTASELSAVYSPTVAKAVLLATAVETSTAYTTLAVKSALLGTASDTSAAGDLTALKAFLVETASELSAVYSLTTGKSILLATATELAAAYDIAATKAYLLATATEANTAADVALDLSGAVYLLDTASELNAAYSFAAFKAVVLEVAQELDAAWTFGGGGRSYVSYLGAAQRVYTAVPSVRVLSEF